MDTFRGELWLQGSFLAYAPACLTMRFMLLDFKHLETAFPQTEVGHTA